MRNVKNTMIDKVLAIVAPHLCCGCGKTGTLLCIDCKYDIIQKPFNDCLLCHKPTSVGICPEHFMHYERAYIVGERTSTLQRVIGDLKFQNMKSAAEILADLLHERLPLLPTDTILVPIPTAPSHIRERGYDHALLIARHLGFRRHLPVSQLLGRARTDTQHHANRKERIQQALAAFRLTGEVDPTKHYVIIDDVITTGATIEFASQILKNAGATSVWIAALARQPLD